MISLTLPLQLKTYIPKIEGTIIDDAGDGSDNQALVKLPGIGPFDELVVRASDVKRLFDAEGSITNTNVDMIIMMLYAEGQTGVAYLRASTVRMIWTHPSHVASTRRDFLVSQLPVTSTHASYRP